MAPPHVQLFGGFTITPGDGALPLLTRTRHQAFLAYLLLHCRQPHARAQLAAHFWPDSSDQQANKNLRVLLVEVRQVWPTLDHFVQIERTTLCWQPAQPVTIDLLAFEAALQRATLAQQSKRRLLHRQVALALETLHADDLDAVSAQIALHYEQAGHLAQAITFYDRAAQSAQRLYANDEAVGHLRRSLALVQSFLSGNSPQAQDLSTLLLYGTETLYCHARHV